MIHLYPDKMVFLSEEHLLKAIQQTHPKTSVQIPYLQVDLIHSVIQCMFIDCLLYV